MDTIAPVESGHVTADDSLRAAADIAAINLLFAQQALGERLADETITTKSLLDIAEHSYRVSGMAKKQEAKEDTGKFVFNISFSGGQSVTVEKEITGETLDADTPEELLAQASRIGYNLDFSAAPEFS